MMWSVARVVAPRLGSRCLGTLVAQRPLAAAHLAAGRAKLPSAGLSFARRTLASKPFVLHDIGEGIAEVEVLQWFVKAGDKVQQFDKICEVQSDKATVEISSPLEGTVESIAYAVGDTAKVEMDEIMALRQQLKPLAADLGVPKFTLMPLIVKATSMALHQFPELNASVSADCTQLTVKASHNIGVAMDTPNGLLVPNIKDVANLNLLQVAQELARLQKDASAGKLQPADLKGGTFTLSNIGNLGGTYTGPVINLPEIAIAGLGKIRPTPRYDEAGALVRKSVMQVSWAADHRVVDGAMMARFSNAWISILEKPASFLLLQ